MWSVSKWYWTRITTGSSLRALTLMGRGQSSQRFTTLQKECDFYCLSITVFWPLNLHISMLILLSVLFHFLWCWQGICSTVKTFSVGDHSLYSHDPNVWFRGDIVKRNKMLVIVRDRERWNGRQQTTVKFQYVVFIRHQ